MSDGDQPPRRADHRVESDGDADPRVTGEYVRRLPGGDDRGDVVLVGVVHDHPASVVRVRSLLEAETPAVLALELPPLAVALFEHYAADGATGAGDDGSAPPRFGGEMSAAVHAADGVRVAGIDGPATGFLRHLVGALREEAASASTVRSTVRRVASITRHAVGCRLAASLHAHTSLRVEVDSPTPHDVGWSDAPERQAADERRHVRRARSVMSAFQRTPASRCCETAREAHMAERLEGLREDGDVLAVVGVGHLDAVRERLASA